MSDKNKRISAFIDYLIEAFGIQTKESEGPARINLNTYQIQKLILSALNFANQNKYGLSCYELHYAIKEMLDSISFRKVDPNSPEWKGNLEILSKIAEISDTVDNVMEDYRVGVEEQINLTPLFLNKPAKDLTLQSIIDLDNIFQNKEQNDIRSYVFKQGEGTHKDLTNDYHLSENLIIVKDVSDWLNYYGLSEGDYDKTQVAIFFIEDDPIDYSYFVVGIKYKGTLWIATESLEFDTPRNKKTSRNPARRREGSWDKMWLPYQLIDEIDDIRKNQTALITEDSKIEYYDKPLEDLPQEQRLFILGLIENTIQEIKKGELDQIFTLGDFVNNQFLLEGEVHPYDLSDGFKGFEAPHKEIYSEIEETVSNHEGQSTALTVISTDLITKSPYYDKNWLGTREQLDNVTKFIILEDKAIKTRSTLVQIKHNEHRDTNKLADMMEQNFENLLPFVFSSDEVLFEVDSIKSGIGFNVPTEIEKNALRFSYPSKSLHTLGWFGRDSVAVIGMRASDYEKAKNHPSVRYHPTEAQRKKFMLCFICGKRPALPQRVIHVRHWKVLAFLAGVEKRTDLPPYYSMYRAHNLVPYHGNSILDNVNPLSLLEDHLSDRQPNGINISFCTCGVCRNSLEKKYKNHEKTIITEGENGWDLKEYSGDPDGHGSVIKHGGFWRSSGH